MEILVIILLLLLAASGFIIFKLYKGNKPEQANSVQMATKEILNHDVGAVLIISNDDRVLYYNNEFAQLFPTIKGLNTIADRPGIQKLFASKEYVSEEFSKIYEIRTETLSDSNDFSGRFVWLVDITGHYKTNKK